MLAYKYRFHGHGSLRYVYRNGSALRTSTITLKCSINTRRKWSRVAVVVSKKVLKSAVGRNRIRRRVYEVMHLELESLAAAHDIVLIVTSSEVGSMPSNELHEIIKDLLKGAHLYKTTP